MGRQAICEIDVAIGVRIRQFRKKVGLSQRALAQSLQLTVQQVQKYETGANRVAAGRLFCIASRLGVPVQVLYPAPMLEIAASHVQQWIDPEREVLNFLSSGENWRLFCAFRDVVDKEQRHRILDLIEGLSEAQHVGTSKADSLPVERAA